jgi:hypothetical protein
MDQTQVNLDQAIDFITKNKKAIFFSAFTSSLIAITASSLPSRFEYKSEVIVSVGSKIQWNWLHQKIGLPTELVESVGTISEGLKGRKQLTTNNPKGLDLPIKQTVEAIPNTALLKISAFSKNYNLNKEALDNTVHWLIDEHTIKLDNDIKILDAEIKNIQLNIKQFRSVIANLNEFLKTSKIDLATSASTETENQMNGCLLKPKNPISVCDFREIFSRLETYQDREKTYGLDLERAKYLRSIILANPTKLVSFKEVDFVPIWRQLLIRGLLSFIAGAILAILVLLIFNKRWKPFIK